MTPIQHIKFVMMTLRTRASDVRKQALCFFNPIKTPEDYRRALWDVCALWDAKQGTIEGKKLDRLAMYVDDYEQKNIVAFWGNYEN